MTTQAARVALWVPTISPADVGDGIIVTATPAGPQAPLPTTFFSVVSSSKVEAELAKKEE